jgi:HEPN domain-containing protein
LKRQDFRELALLRLKEAEVLFANGCWAGAYYLAGYAVECALKACIAKRTERHEFPDLKRIKSSYTHDLVELLRVADLNGPLREATQSDSQFALNWLSVEQWSVEARYERRSESDAKALLEAVQNRRYGVLPWLKKHW